MERLDYAKISSPAYQAMFGLEKAIASLGVDTKIKDLVRIRVSQINGCVFCLDMHVKEARVHEERELRLHHLPVWHESPLFSDKEKAALRWAELLTQFKPDGVNDEEYRRALDFFTEKELSDLTFAVTSINAWNRLGVAFRTKPGLYDQMMGLNKAGLE